KGNVYERNDRIACGSSCAPMNKTYAGTFGALVKRTGKDGIWAISNNHVFADCNHSPSGTPISSPAAQDTKPSPARAPTMFCEHAGIEELRSGTPTFVSRCEADLAIASVPDDTAVTSWQGGADGYDTPTALKSPQRRLKVKKTGRTTGQTHGIIVG